METFSNPEKDFCVEITRKKIKNFNIRISSDGKVRCSVPLNSRNKDITELINSKKNWIISHINKIKFFQNSYNENITDNGSIRILGRLYKIKITQSMCDSAFLNDDELKIYAPDVEDKSHINNIYKNFIRSEMQKYFEFKVDEFYPAISNFNKTKPSIKIRKMRRCWGICKPRRNEITFNENLYKASPFCIDYVVLHELAHFIHPNHSKKFYDFIATHMPDWKERKNQLNLGNF